MRWEDDIVLALEHLGGIAGYDDIYAEIKRIRTNLPKNWKAVVRRRVQDLSSDSAGFKDGKNLFFSVNGLHAGVWGLRSALTVTPEAVDLPDGTEDPKRAYGHTYRVLRDTVLARKIKLLHKDRCQICGEVVSIGNGKTYAEAHHIIPLGAPHGGPDTAENIIVLCPNHHVLCDYGAIKLSMQNITCTKGHVISAKSIEYHNEKIVKMGYKDR